MTSRIGSFSRYFVAHHGLMVSSFLTLFIIPVIYTLVERAKARLVGLDEPEAESGDIAPDVGVGELAPL